MRKLLVLFVVIYQRVVSPWLAPQCRFYPSCSQWTREAVESYGVLRGLALALVRLLSCHPFHPGGFHPAPQEAQPVKAGRNGEKLP